MGETDLQLGGGYRYDPYYRAFMAGTRSTISSIRCVTIPRSLT